MVHILAERYAALLGDGPEQRIELQSQAANSRPNTADMQDFTRYKAVKTDLCPVLVSPYPHYATSEM